MTSLDAQLSNDRTRRLAVFIVVIGLGLICAAIGAVTAPEPLSLALLVLILACATAFVRPTVGVYVLVVLTLIGDTVTMPWWPFTKNMSSRESVLFIADQVIVNPMEILVGVTILGWLMRRLADPLWRFNRGALLVPLLTLTGFVVLGILRGRLAGGDTRVAIFEFRPLLYLPVVYVLITNLFTTRRQYRTLLVLSMVAIALQSIFSLVYYVGLPPDERQLLESLSEHAATIHMNALFVMLLAMWTLKGSGRLRWFLLVVSVPVAWAYLLSQRRAAMVSLFVGLAALVIVLYHRRRRAFWFVTPAGVLVGLGLVAAAWNATGPIGLPAQAVKTVLFPNELSQADQDSNSYRLIEAYDLWFTIRQTPLTGVGFGQRFYMPASLPDISVFEFWEYMPHNSVLWVWLKTGYFGFAAMLFLFGRAVQLGARSALLVRTREQAALVVTGLSYALMFLVFAYVDIVWDPRSTIFLAVAFAMCADYERARDVLPSRPERVHRHQLESLPA